MLSYIWVHGKAKVIIGDLKSNCSIHVRFLYSELGLLSCHVMMPETITSCIIQTLRKGALIEEQKKFLAEAALMG